MTFILGLLIVLAGGALGRRFDGGLLSEWAGVDIGRWEARASWAVVGVLALLAFALSRLALPNWFIVASALWLPLGSAAWGNSGRPLRTVLNHLSLLLHGLAVMAVPVLTAWWVGGLWVVPLGAALLTVPLYLLANRTPASIPWLGVRPGDPEPLAELLCGGVWLVGVLGGGLHG